MLTNQLYGIEHSNSFMLLICWLGRPCMGGAWRGLWDEKEKKRGKEEESSV
jgi:hypothetical protein